MLFDREELSAWKKYQEANDDAAFPDEVLTPRDIPASIRFRKYRGLASFRTSQWDNKEDLPLNYARIFQFENFDRTRKRVMTEEEEEAMDLADVGEYVTLHISSVPAAFHSRDATVPLVLLSLLQHENKMSVLHFQITMRPDFDEPIKYEILRYLN